MFAVNKLLKKARSSRGEGSFDSAMSSQDGASNSSSAWNVSPEADTAAAPTSSPWAVSPFQTSNPFAKTRSASSSSATALGGAASSTSATSEVEPEPAHEPEVVNSVVVEDVSKVGAGFTAAFEAVKAAPAEPQDAAPSSSPWTVSSQQVEEIKPSVQPEEVVNVTSNESVEQDEVVKVEAEPEEDELEHVSWTLEPIHDEPVAAVQSFEAEATNQEAISIEAAPEVVSEVVATAAVSVEETKREDEGESKQEEVASVSSAWNTAPVVEEVHVEEHKTFNEKEEVTESVFIAAESKHVEAVEDVVEAEVSAVHDPWNSTPIVEELQKPAIEVATIVTETSSATTDAVSNTAVVVEAEVQAEAVVNKELVEEAVIEDGEKVVVDVSEQKDVVIEAVKEVDSSSASVAWNVEPLHQVSSATSTEVVAEIVSAEDSVVEAVSDSVASTEATSLSAEEAVAESQTKSEPSVSEETVGSAWNVTVTEESHVAEVVTSTVSTAVENVAPVKEEAVKTLQEAVSNGGTKEEVVAVEESEAAPVTKQSLADAFDAQASTNSLSSDSVAAAVVAEAAAATTSKSTTQTEVVTKVVADKKMASFEGIAGYQNASVVTKKTKVETKRGAEEGATGACGACACAIQ